MLWYIPCQRTIEWNAVCDIKSDYDIVYEVEVSDFLVNSVKSIEKPQHILLKWVIYGPWAFCCVKWKISVYIFLFKTIFHWYILKVSLTKRTSDGSFCSRCYRFLSRSRHAKGLLILSIFIISHDCRHNISISAANSFLSDIFY